MIKYKKTVSIFLLLGLLLPSFAFINVPSASADVTGGSWAAATASWAHFAKYVLKEFILDLAARLVARLQLTGNLNAIAGQLIQSGRTGRSPGFIQNWRNFITDAEYRGEDVFRSVLANTRNCPHFRRDILSVFGVRGASSLTQNTRVNNLDPYTYRGRCTLPAGWRLENYNQDFAGNGGWEALLRLSEPQNNFYGAFLMSLTELDNQRALDRQADRSEGEGDGFTGVRRSTITGNSCDTPPITGGQCITDPWGDGSIGSFCNTDGRTCTSNADCQSPQYNQARCSFLGNITTPSKILGEAGANFIDKNLGFLVTSDEISEILGNFIQTMIGRLANFTANSIASTPSNENTQRTAYDACVRTCNNQSSGSQYGLCIDRCSRNAGVDLPPNYDSFSTGQPPPPPGGGGACSGVVGQVANYQGNLQTAINAVIAANPGGIADQFNTVANSFTFLNLVATELQNAGFNATTGVLNGNGNTNSGDLIALWRPGDTYAERYDAIQNVGAGTTALRTAATAGQYVGDITFTCVPGSGGGGGGGTPQVRLCEGQNFGGICETFSATDNNLDDNSIANLVSSVELLGGATNITLCTDQNGGGVCEVFNASDPDVGNNPAPAIGHDTASSIIFGPPPPTGGMVCQLNACVFDANATSNQCTSDVDCGAPIP